MATSRDRGDSGREMAGTGEESGWTVEEEVGKALTYRIGE